MVVASSPPFTIGAPGVPPIGVSVTVKVPSPPFKYTFATAFWLLQSTDTSWRARTISIGAGLAGIVNLCFATSQPVDNEVATISYEPPTNCPVMVTTVPPATVAFSVVVDNPLTAVIV